MIDLRKEHTNLEIEVLEQSPEARANLIPQIEQFCVSLKKFYSQMNFKDKKYAQTSLEFWEVQYRRITGKELDILLK